MFTLRPDDEERGRLTARVLMLSLRSPDPRGLGGIELHTDALLSHAPEAVTVYAAYLRAGELRVESGRPRKLDAAFVLRDAGSTLDVSDALVAALGGTRSDVLHVHAPALGPAMLADVIRRAGVAAVVTLHDHSLVCENYELLEGGKRYCGIPADLGRCRACLRTTFGPEAGGVEEWRRAMERLVSATDAFVVPSESVLEHAARLYPLIRRRARHIAWGVPPPSARSAISAAGGPLRVAIVGLLATVKGRDRLGALLGAAREVGAEWHVFGATEGDALRDVRHATRNVVVHGAYPRRALGSRLVRAGCHVAVLPSVGAEAFSLTLSEIASIGLPVLASDLGALGERVRTEGLGWTFDPWDEAAFAALLGELDRDRTRIDRVANQIRSLPLRTEAQMAAEHAELWSKLAARPERSSRTVSSELEASFRAAQALAARRRPSRLSQAIEDFRSTDFYRDLSLRRAVPVGARKKLEEIVMRLAARAGRQ